MIDLLLEVARALLLSEIEKALVKKVAPISQKKRVADLFHQYEDNGGNHGLKDFFEMFMQLPEDR